MADFNTITGDDWKRSLKMARNYKNSVSQQIMEQIKQQGCGGQEANVNELFVQFFNKVQKDMNQTAHEKGWYESPIGKTLDDGGITACISTVEELKNMRTELQGIEDARRIALMHSELSEGLEGLRHGNPPSDHIPEFSAIEEELADCIVRIMDVAQERGWRVAEALIAKAAFNKTRSHRHGNKKF